MLQCIGVPVYHESKPKEVHAQNVCRYLLGGGGRNSKNNCFLILDTTNKIFGARLRPRQVRKPLLVAPKRSPPLLKNGKYGSQKCWKNTYEVHLEVTRLERHAIFRRSISLDDVDCFDTRKAQTYQWHKCITLLFQRLRSPVRVVLMRTSCLSRFLCDVIE